MQILKLLFLVLGLIVSTRSEARPILKETAADGRAIRIDLVRSRFDIFLKNSPIGSRYVLEFKNLDRPALQISPIEYVIRTEKQAIAILSSICLPFGPGRFAFKIRYEAPSQSEIFSSSEFTLAAADHLGEKCHDVPSTYLEPSAYVQSDEKEIVDLARSLIKKGTSSLSAGMATSLAIYDWVAQNIKYDTRVFRIIRLPNGGRVIETTPVMPEDALTSLRTRTAVCWGYSTLLAALHRAVKIPAKVIRGEATLGNEVGPHAWNQILVDGKWINVDATAGSGSVVIYPNDRFVFVPKLNRAFFNPDEPSVFAKNYRADVLSMDLF